MKILLYADVHGNKYALKELQKTDDYKTADMRIFLGDVFAMCPYSKECLKSLIKSKDILIMGNHDSYGAFGLPVEEWPYFNEAKILHQKFMRDKLGVKLQKKLSDLPKNYSLEVGNKKFYFTHYAWENDKFVMDDPDEPSAASEKTAKLFSGVKADYIFFAHNHQPSNFKYKNKHFICTGSLGMKRVGNYVLIETIGNEISIVHKKLHYDVDKLISEMKAQNYPAADKYIKWFDDTAWQSSDQI